MKDISAFVRALKSFLLELELAPVRRGMFNPWAQSCPLETDTVGYKARRARLAQHLNCSPRLLLIGEAPGYQGCRYSGVWDAMFVNSLVLWASAFAGSLVFEVAGDRYYQGRRTAIGALAGLATAGLVVALIIAASSLIW